ncbi:hypothetical protein J4Q44_G00329500 [Coregonus suidteri]|uniref:Uncharacterized protein n=1 Tax=Coregonus suidteri TaxID=861788 RepID=A0AAN8QHH2_9TELE
MLNIMGCLVRKILHHTFSLSCSGETDGKGWLSLLDMSDARASVLDKNMPFRLLRIIGVLYVPASTEERRKTVHPPIIPSPGSYPVHAHAPVSSNLQATETTPKTFEGWAHSYYTQGSPVQLSGANINAQTEETQERPLELITCWLQVCGLGVFASGHLPERNDGKTQ